MPPRSASAPTATTSGAEPDARALSSWARRLSGLAVVRDLPWRRSRDPWAILVSEVMLQQTQVSRVIPAWEALVEELPDPAACASAGQAEVVRRWAGLGYNRRARNLHAAAVAIVEDHDGAVPRSLDALMGLPGVGAYTARAVKAFAFEDDVAVVDTNVARVLVRAVAGRRLGAAALQRTADRLVPDGDAWRHNQAMLDHGALVCTARQPSCQSCALRRSCAFRKAGSTAGDPAAKDPGRRQPRFEGSARQARGRIVELLRRGALSAGDLAALSEQLGEERSSAAVDALVAEGMAKRTALGLELAG